MVNRSGCERTPTHHTIDAMTVKSMQRPSNRCNYRQIIDVATVQSSQPPSNRKKHRQIYGDTVQSTQSYVQTVGNAKSTPSKEHSRSIGPPRGRTRRDLPIPGLVGKNRGHQRNFFAEKPPGGAFFRNWDRGKPYEPHWQKFEKSHVR